ncbi:UNVERIFIED_ORG: hypothetical protein ABIB19_002198 [Arthrobacter sp. UYEF10]
MLSTVTIIDDSSPGSSATVCAVGTVRYRALLPNVEPTARLFFSARVVPVVPFAAWFRPPSAPRLRRRSAAEVNWFR